MSTKAMADPVLPALLNLEYLQDSQGTHDAVDVVKA